MSAGLLIVSNDCMDEDGRASMEPLSRRNLERSAGFGTEVTTPKIGKKTKK